MGAQHIRSVPFHKGVKLRRALIYLAPAILLVLIVYPIGIQTNCVSRAWAPMEADPAGPGMPMNDISQGFMRHDAARAFSFFHPALTSIVYAPYVWFRAGELPPYNLGELEHKYPWLKGELIILSRALNVAAALGLVIIAFYIIFILTGDLKIAAFTSLSVAMNANLMFQSSVTYYENWALLWVFLSVICFLRLFLKEDGYVPWLFSFAVFMALAISTHERMTGYYLLSLPATVWRIWEINRNKPQRIMATLKIFAATVLMAVLAFAFVNNCFFAGVKPVFQYLHCKSVGISSSERLHGLWPLIRNQLGCHGHTVRLVFWNLGGITLLIAILGFWHVYRIRCRPALALLLFPLGYQILSIGLPGWTSGRYILGQTIFATIFAGLGVWKLFFGKIKGRVVIVAVALLMQLSIMVMIKIADTYYHPRRVIETIALQNRSTGTIIGVLGFEPLPEDWCDYLKIHCVNVADRNKPAGKVDILISAFDVLPFSYSYLKNEELRRPPGWLVALVKEECYLYSDGASLIDIRRRGGL